MNDERLQLAGLGFVVAAVVIAAASLRDVSLPMIVGAALISVIGFVLIDGFLARSATTASGPTGPTGGSHGSTESGGVEPPRVGEPTRQQFSEEPVTKAAKLDPDLLEEDHIEVKAAKSKGRIFTVRVAKHGSSLAECEDAVSIDPKRGIVSVADGASSSFGSGEWAAMLTKSFTKSAPAPLSVGGFAQWLGSCRAAGDKQAGSHDQGGWWSEEGARRGAFATLVGASLTRDGNALSATVMCLGDSCAFLLRPVDSGLSVRRSIPYEDASQFGSHPSLLSSSDEHGHDEPSWTVLPVERGDLLVLGTDAVSEWLLGDQKRFELLVDSNPGELANRLVAERTAGNIVNDDMTLAVFEIPA